MKSVEPRMNTNQQERKLEVTKELYWLCFVMDLMESARSYGLITGGYLIHQEKIDEVLAEGERLGYPVPNQAEIRVIVNGIQADIASKKLNHEGHEETRR